MNIDSKVKELLSLSDLNFCMQVYHISITDMKLFARLAGDMGMDSRAGAILDANEAWFKKTTGRNHHRYNERLTIGKTR